MSVIFLLKEGKKICLLRMRIIACLKRHIKGLTEALKRVSKSCTCRLVVLCFL